LNGSSSSPRSMACGDHAGVAEAYVRRQRGFDVHHKAPSVRLFCLMRTISWKRMSRLPASFTLLITPSRNGCVTNTCQSLELGDGNRGDRRPDCARVRDRDCSLQAQLFFACRRDPSCSDRWRRPRRTPFRPPRWPMSGTRRPGRGRLVNRPHKERTHADLSADSRAPAHQVHSDVQRIRPNRGEARAANC
jgi:hypothetical protein